MRSFQLVLSLFIIGLTSCLGADTSPDPGYCPDCAPDSGSGGSAGGGSGGESGAGGTGGDGGGGTGGTSNIDAGPEAGIDAGPCTMSCDGATPVCDEEAGECVRCVENTHCASTPSTPVCDRAADACVQCLENADCSGMRDRCDTDARTCVECLVDGDCGSGVCNAEHACVECNEDSDCDDATKARCAAEVCTPCMTNAHCEHIEGKHVCDDDECVQCTGTQYDDCPTDSGGDQLVCESETRTCSTTLTERSTGLCGSCVSDAQCFAGQLCVEQRFGTPEQAVGHFCFWNEDAMGTGAPEGSCFSIPPFVGVKPMQTSIDGTEANVCGLRVTTCPGYQDFSQRDCESMSEPGAGDDAVCGFEHASTPDAYCRQVPSGTPFRCTLPCGSDDDCVTGFTCNTSVVPRVCGL